MANRTFYGKNDGLVFKEVYTGEGQNTTSTIKVFDIEKKEFINFDEKNMGDDLAKAMTVNVITEEQYNAYTI